MRVVMRIRCLQGVAASNSLPATRLLYVLSSQRQRMGTGTDGRYRLARHSESQWRSRPECNNLL